MARRTIQFTRRNKVVMSSLLSPNRADACMPPLVAMPIMQAPNPAPHELANCAPAWIVINIHDRVRHYRSSSS